MSRFPTADDDLVPFSQRRPDRFSFQEYQPPPEGDEVRAIDDAPEHDDRGPSVFANVGFAHMKRR